MATYRPLLKPAARERLRRITAAIGVAAVAFTSAVVFGNVAAAPKAAAIVPFPIKDTSAGASGTVNPLWTVLPGSTGSPGRYTSDGWTRLTNSATGQAANIINTASFPSSTGFSVTFDYRSAGGSTFYDDPQFGDGTYKTADGLAMYLFDGRIDGTTARPYTTGASGAGLGYAGGGQPTTSGNSCSSDGALGVRGGYLGLGIDTFGNFGVSRSGQTGGTAKNTGPVIAVRGSGGKDYTKDNCAQPAAESYPMIASRPSTSLWTGVAGNTSDPATYNSDYRRVRVTVTPVVVSGVSTVNVKATISPKAKKGVEPTGAWIPVIDTNVAGTNQAALPANLKLGFSASTGLGTDYHDVRNIQVQASTDAKIDAAVTSTGSQGGKYAPGETIKMSYTATNQGPTIIGTAPTGMAKVYTKLPSVLTNATWTCTPTGKAVCGAASGTVGSDGVINVNWAGEKGDTVRIDVTGQAGSVAGDYTANAVVPVNSDINANPGVVDATSGSVQTDAGAVDFDPSNNSAAYAFSVVTPNFTATKSADRSSYALGQAVTYTVTVTNGGGLAGTASLTDAVPASVTPESVDCTATAGSCTKGLSGQNVTGTVNLPAGASATFTVKGTAKAAGSAQNSATITPTSPACAVVGNSCGGATPDSGPVTVNEQKIDFTPTVVDDATSAPVTNYTVGQVLRFTYSVTNTGTVPLNSVTVNQGLSAGDITGLPAPTCTSTTLAVGATTACTSKYTVTQADVDAGTITSTAKVTGKPVGGGTDAASAAKPVSVTAVRSTNLSMVATATPADGDTTVDATSDSVNYVYKLTNNGNVTITGAGVNIPAFSGSPKPTVNCSSTTIAPGATLTCTATYAVTQADLDRGSITQTARPVGTSSVGQPSVTDSNTTVGVKANSSISASAADFTVAPSTYSKVGDTLSYTIKVTNDGNQTLSKLAAVKGAFDGDATALSAPQCAATTLAPGQSTTCTYTYKVTQADLDRGSVTDHASVTAEGANAAKVQTTERAAQATTKETPAISATAALNVPANAKAGTKVPVTFSVTNDSNVTLNKVGVKATMTQGNGALSAITCTPATLAPGASASCTADYTLTQADVDRGSIAISGTAEGTTPAGVVAKASASADGSANITQASSTSTSATVAPSTFKKTGDKLTFTVTSKNTGNTTLSKVDNQLASFTGDASALTKNCSPAAPATLAPGESMVCTYSYTVTQDDVDNDAVSATPKTEATGPAQASAASSGSEVKATAADAAANTQTTVTAAPTSFDSVGQKVTFTLSVKNTGDMSVTNPSLAAENFTGSTPLSALTCPTTTTLKPGASFDCTVEYSVTQADLDRGTIKLGAKSTVKVAGKPDFSSTASPAVVTASQAPKLGITMSSDTTELTGANQNIKYTVTATNKGNTSLSKVSVGKDSFTGTGTLTVSSCQVGGQDVTNGDVSLAPGESLVCVLSYTTTQADLDSGSLKLVARTDGTAPDGSKVSAKTADDAEGGNLPVKKSAALSVTKTAAQSTVSAVGGPVDYSITVTNSGNVTVNEITLADTGFTGAGKLEALVCKDNGTLSLAPGDSVTCTISYKAVQADLDGTGFDNSAKADGKDPQGAAVSAKTGAAAHVTPNQRPAISVAKAANVSSVSAPGDKITYTITASNVGNTTLSAVSLEDIDFTGAGTLDALSCPTGKTNGDITLAPGESVKCTVTYTVTQADLDSGKLSNGAHATGTGPQGQKVEDKTDSSNATSVTSTDTPGLQIAGGASVSEATAAGQHVTYTFTVTNSGNRKVTDAKLTLKDGTGTGMFAAFKCAGGADAGSLTLEAGASVSCTIEYTVSQADIDADQFVLSAAVAGTSSGGAAVSAQLPAAIVVTTPDAPALSQTAEPFVSSFASAGASIGYTVTTTNTGTTTLANVFVGDPSVNGAGSLSGPTCTVGGKAVENGKITLAPGQAVACDYSYTTTQADVDGTGVIFKDAAKGTPPASPDVTAASTASTVFPSRTPTVAVSKVASGDPVTAAGGVVTYTITATNTGNATLSALTLADSDFNGDPQQLKAGACKVGDQDANNAQITLAPGQSASCVFTYTTQQADLDRGSLSNSAIASGSAPGNAKVLGKTTAPTEVQLHGTSSLEVTKVATPQTVKAVGDVITYTITAKNTGTRTLSKVKAVDAQFTGTGTLSDPVCTSGGQTVTNGSVVLAPNATVDCVLTYKVTQADLDSSGLSNSAVADAVDPDGGAVTDQPDKGTPVVITRDARLDINVVSSLPSLSEAGQVVDFTFTTTNSGNATVKLDSSTPAVLEGTGTSGSYVCRLGGQGDPVKPGDVTLAPGDKLVCTMSYTASQADIDGQGVTVAATSKGTTTQGQKVELTSSQLQVSPVKAPGLTATKKASTDKVVKAGDQIRYTLTAKNTGNVTLSKVGVEDTNFTGTGTLTPLSCTIGSDPATSGSAKLAPGESLVCITDYTVTQQDLDSGKLSNGMKGSATDPDDNSITDEPDNPNVIIGSRSPAIAATLAADPTTASKAGDTITLTLGAKNTGNTTLSGVSVTPQAFTGTGDPLVLSCKQGGDVTNGEITLAPNATVECTAVYRLTQADVDRGELSLENLVKGTSTDGVQVTDTAKTDKPLVTIAGAPAVKVSKVADLLGADKITKAGQPIRFLITVENTGNTTLNKVTAQDTNFTGTGTLSAADCAVDGKGVVNGQVTLVPGQKLVCIYNYEVTQADLDGKGLSNTAKATGQGPTGPEVIDETEKPTVPPMEQRPGLSVDKTVDAGPTGKLVSLGQELRYTITAHNTGTTTLTGVSVKDTDFTGSGTLGAPECTVGGTSVENGKATLAPGQSLSCVLLYHVTQADLDGEGITNAASAHGTTSTGEDIVAKVDKIPAVPSDPQRKLETTISADRSEVTAAGQVVTYTVHVANLGNRTVSGIDVSGAGFTGTGKLGDPTCTVNGKSVDNGKLSIGSGESLDCVMSYTVTQADVDAKEISLGALAVGKDATDVKVEDASDAPAVVTPKHTPSLQLNKTASVTTVAKAGDPIRYTITATNDGNVTISGITMSDTGFTGTGVLGDPQCTVNGKSAENGKVSLAPGESVSCTLDYSVTQADIDGKGLSNGARVTGTDPDDGKIDKETENPNVIGTDGKPGLQIVKNASRTSVSAAGDKVDYTITLSNTGDLTVNQLTVKDTGFTGSGTLDALVCKADGKGVDNGSIQLAPKASVDCTVTYSVTQKDMDGTSFQNEASAAGTEKEGKSISVETAKPTEVTVTAKPALSVTKTVDQPTFSKLSTVLNYTLRATNDGNRTLSLVEIEDVDFTGAGTVPSVKDCTVDGGNVDNGKVTLDPGQSVECAASYSVVQADLDGTNVSNSAQAKGTDPGNTVLTVKSADAAVSTPVRQGALSSSVEADKANVDAAGQQVTFTLRTKNTGNTTLSGVKIDPTAQLGAGTLSALKCTVDSQEVENGKVTLAPGQSLECTATLPVTQADIDAKGVALSAHAEGSTVDGAKVGSDGGPATVPSVHASAMTTTKTSDTDKVTGVNQKITYTITVKNTGNLTLSQVKAQDVGFNGTGGVPAFTCTVDGAAVSGDGAQLAPGQSLVCVGVYTVTQADVDGSGLSNSAKGTGKDPDGKEIEIGTPGPETIPSARVPQLKLSKTASVDSVKAAGDKVDYTITVENIGNVTVNDITAADTGFTGKGTLAAPICQVKSGDKLTTVQNGKATLAPKDSLSCVYSYVVVQADIDGKGLSNSAVATGTGPDGEVKVVIEDPKVTPIERTPGVSTAITVTPTAVDSAGTKTPFSITVTNTGNVSLKDLVVKGVDFTGTGTAGDPVFGTPKASRALKAAQAPSGTVALLAPGQSVTGTVAYTATQADLDQGGYAMGSTVQGTDVAEGKTVEAASAAKATVGVNNAPALSVTKKVSAPSFEKEGDKVTYTITVSNPGNLTVNGITVKDQGFTGHGSLGALNCGQDLGKITLAPGASIDCTVDYTVVQADVDAGELHNGALATGTAANGAEVKAETKADTVLTTPNRTADLDATITSPDANIGKAGDVVEYTVVLRNSGSTTLSNVKASELQSTGTGKFGTYSCTLNGASSESSGVTLKPGQSLECVVSYTATQADIDAKDVTVKVTGSATGPANTSNPTATASLKQTTQGENALEVTKATPGVTELNDVGQKLDYVITAKNNGAQTLSKVKVQDTDFTGHGTLGTPECTVGSKQVTNGSFSLAPGDVVECHFAYTTTQKDLDQGGLKNSATVKGTDPDGKVVEGKSDASNGGGSVIPTKKRASIAVAKQASREEIVKAGDKIDYTVTVTNTGNVSVKDITAEDTEFSGTGALAAPVCKTSGKGVQNGSMVLGSGQSVDCVFSYKATQADVDSGKITNSAKATGTDVLAGKATKAASTARQAVPAPAAQAANANANAQQGSLIAAVAALAPAAVDSVEQAAAESGQLTAATTSPTVVTVRKAAAITVTKSANVSSLEAPGQKITYTVTAANTGNLTLHNVLVQDVDFTGTGKLAAGECTQGAQGVSNAQITLAPGQKVSCVFEYTTTREDVLTGSLGNAGLADGLTPQGDSVTDRTDAALTLTSKGGGALAITKTADVASVNGVGDKITYTITASNTGEGPLSKVDVVDTGFTGRGSLSAPECKVGQEAVTSGEFGLAPGESVTCTLVYTVVEADLGGGVLANGATATGVRLDGTVVTAHTDGITKVELPQKPLPPTGAAVMWIVMAAGVLVVLGLILLVVRRRRRAE